MSIAKIRAAARLSRTLFAIAFGVAAAACGGGGEESAVALADSSAAAAPAATAAHKTAPPVFVALEGCVLDRFYVPTTGTPVRALTADGRLLGNAISDGHGRFAMRLPARSEVRLQIDRPQGESLPMRVDATPSTWETCLLDELA